MNPDDKKLTECAARAVGKEVLGWIGDDIHTRDHPDASPDIGQFDPLNDMGDAILIAIEKGFSVDFLNGIVRSPRGEILAVSEIDIKRAIVRAAAAEIEVANPKAIVSVTITPGVPITATTRAGTVIDVAREG